MALDSDYEPYSSFYDWFFSLEGSKLFCVVSQHFLSDSFNLLGLNKQVSDFEESLEILRGDPPDYGFPAVGDSDFIPEALRSASLLYGLVHARYILTQEGQYKMIEKYENRDFGVCNLYNCHDAAYLPIGLNASPKISHVRFYCPRCDNIYEPPSNELFVDGAYFGSTFPHLLLMDHPELRPIPNRNNDVSKIFDFQLHPRAIQIQYESQTRDIRSQK